MFLVFKSIYTVLCTEHVIYLYQSLAHIITLHEVASGQECRHVELSDSQDPFYVCSLELIHFGF